MRNILRLGAVVVITALVAAAAVYGLTTKKALDERDQLQSENLSLRSRVRDLETAAQATPTPSPTPSPTPAPATDNDLAAKAVQDDCSSQPGADVANGVFTVSKLVGAFATVNFSCSTATADNRAILKKTGSTWAVIYKGAAAPPKATITKYGIPKDFQ